MSMAVPVSSMSSSGVSYGHRDASDVISDRGYARSGGHINVLCFSASGYPGNNSDVERSALRELPRSGGTSSGVARA